MVTTLSGSNKIILTGYLIKKAIKSQRNWKKRYFVLTEAATGYMIIDQLKIFKREYIMFF